MESIKLLARGEFAYNGFNFFIAVIIGCVAKGCTY